MGQAAAVEGEPLLPLRRFGKRVAPQQALPQQPPPHPAEAQPAGPAEPLQRPAAVGWRGLTW
jgi:hypothetical protein